VQQAEAAKRGRVASRSVGKARKHLDGPEAEHYARWIAHSRFPAAECALSGLTLPARARTHLLWLSTSWDCSLHERERGDHPSRTGVAGRLAGYSP
jgi:hypothetical protein